MSRLIVVSNRVPLPNKSGEIPAGGLAVGLHGALQERGGLWMGWSGKTLQTDKKPEITMLEKGNISYALIDLSRQDVDEYYAGFANGMLWPLCHYRIDLIDYARQDMSGYFRVNRLFAEQIAPLIEADDIIWVHDYHLIPLASELRQKGISNPIGFFFHIPWPPPDVFFTLPVYEVLLRGLSTFDVVGFQTDFDVENFKQCLLRESVGEDLKNGYFHAYHQRFFVGAFPIGINIQDFSYTHHLQKKSIRQRQMEKSLGDQDLIIGVDRLDYSKGILHRMEAYERFIKAYPGSRGRVSFLQITPKSRNGVVEFDKMQTHIATIVGRINGEYGRIDWTPIRYINQSTPRETLAGLYRMARVGLVTPLRDGMNMVAKEYVAAQNPENPGVLILSRFAGAARELKNALLVNPYDRDGVGDAIARALSMSLEERLTRWKPMMADITKNNITQWCTDFLTVLKESAKMRHRSSL
ncbi:alpha,alpha-trehalose-phosphate synthase (UDP-forming) [Bartonella tamiae]|uniref:Trehalose-6-phosphate synthase n=1 Tax=Bartonella tamiae Th239 TaxID=1094558 RepID=J1K1B6_9HYPH|nr:alpha,alpha-trehalose-phosphate synthase (UDP-forming) [Bartonella tamiae]EJF91247.1 alpha,alpha-trehalose-phosphate synthase (UDP-forming) [Bartonella tamiae Th239]EJF93088.1 alpha,alpha-trehalose-phosphate synthase (UDP-forming) [Bartonella tamiae Th307]